MVLCFAALVKVLKVCSKPKVHNKTLCGALVKTIDGKSIYTKKTQEDVANLACISVSSVGEIERARRKPSIEALAGLSCALDISLDFLILGIESRCAMERCLVYEETTGLLRYHGLDGRKR